MIDHLVLECMFVNVALDYFSEHIFNYQLSCATNHNVATKEKYGLTGNWYGDVAYRTIPKLPRALTHQTGYNVNGKAHQIKTNATYVCLTVLEYFKNAICMELRKCYKGAI